MAQVGDIVVYSAFDSTYNADKITHTGKIIEVKPDGTIIVESKWGRLGRYKHKVNSVPSFYGTATVCHTDRVGEGTNRHILNTGQPPQPTAVSNNVSWGQLKSLFGP